MFLSGSKIKKLSENNDVKIETYQDCFDICLCQTRTEKCFFSKCQDCPGKTALENNFKHILETNNINEIACNQWINNPKTTIIKSPMSREDFINKLCDQIQNLLVHDFIFASSNHHL